MDQISPAGFFMTVETSRLLVGSAAGEDYLGFG
jgi:hypothetical protein